MEDIFIGKSLEAKITANCKCEEGKGKGVLAGSQAGVSVEQQRIIPMKLQQQGEQRLELTGEGINLI